MNGSTLNPANDMGQDGNTAVQTQQYIGRDAYGYSLHYFEGDYYPINGSTFLTGIKSPLGTSYKGLYNGNISSMAVNIGTFAAPKLYNYSYDQLNRLTKMDGFNGTNTGLNLWTGGLTASTDYQEAVSYDANGNIKTYLRNGYGSTLAMDNLTYNYQAGTNKLTSVSDAVAAANYSTDIDNQAANNYSYDQAGNMLTDVQSGITGMSWSVYGKLLSVTKSSGTITYQYDATGNRISKTAAGVTTWYVRDAQGNILTTYSGTNLPLQEQDLYGSSRLGTIANPTALPLTTQYLDHLGSGTLYAFNRGKKMFELPNHLGNVLATISDKKYGTPSGVPSQVSYYTADVKSAQDYYPGGMPMVGKTFQQGSNSYRYGFNGQMQSNELVGNGNSYNAEYWEYDTRIVKRWNLDPKPNVGISPYSAFNNNPILLADILGDSAGKPGVIQPDNTNYVLPYYPVFGSPSFGAGTKNALLNVGNFLSNISVGILARGGQSVQNYVAGGYKDPSTTNPIQAVIDFSSSQGEYLLHTSLNQQLKDLGNTATDLRNYELPAQLALGGLGTFGKINLSTNFSLGSNTAAADGSFYSVAYEMNLSTKSYPGLYRGAHFKEANTVLDATIKSDQTFAASMQKLGVEIPKSPSGNILGKSPANWVWHHDTNAGVMQLVPKAQHTINSPFWFTLHPGGNGGFSMWGR